jgi:MFS family permease
MKFYGLNGQQWTNVIAAWSGWLMDGYVTIIYALMAAYYLGSVFFPGNFGGSLLYLVLGLAVGAIARSVGSLVFGNYLGDKVGRRNMLMITVIGFSIFSFLIGLLPPYATAGYFALAALYILLFLVGLFAGAEYGGGTALYAETVPIEKRGPIGAFVQSGFGTGYFIAAGIFGLASLYYSDADFINFAWRIMFFTTIIPGIIALISRLGARETPVFQEMVEKMQVERSPVLKMLKENPLPILFAVFITTGLLYINSATIGFYPFIMGPKINNLSAVSSAKILLLANFVSLIGVWLGGIIANRIPGRRLAMMIFSLVFLIALYPLSVLGIGKDVDTLYFAYGVESFLMAMIFSTLPSYLAERFSKKYRSTSVGFTYNAGAIIGGFAGTFIVLSKSFLGLLNGWFINIAIANVLLIVGLALSAETWSKAKAGARDIIQN